MSGVTFPDLTMRVKFFYLFYVALILCKKMIRIGEKIMLDSDQLIFKKHVVSTKQINGKHRWLVIEGGRVLGSET